MDLQPFIERILEVENLTDNLADREAKRLLNWGISLLPSLTEGLANDDSVSDRVGGLMRVMRLINRLLPDRQSLTAADLSEFSEKAGAVFGPSAMSFDPNQIADELSKLDEGQALDLLLKLIKPTNEPAEDIQVDGPAKTNPLAGSQINSEAAREANEKEPQRKLTFFERLFGKRQ